MASKREIHEKELGNRSKAVVKLRPRTRLTAQTYRERKSNPAARTFPRFLPLFWQSPGRWRHLGPKCLFGEETRVTSWIESLTENPFLSGGAVLVILGGILAYCRHLPGKILAFIERFFILKIEILDDDEAYHWMRIWIAQRMAGTLSISVCTRRKNQPDDIDEPNSPRDNRPHVFFVPSPGTYFFLYRGRPVMLTRERNDQPSAGGDGIPRIRECFMIRIWSRNRNLARELVEQCQETALPRDGRIDVRVVEHSYWELGHRIWPRALDSVLLDGHQGHSLLNDMRRFLQSYDWYARIGVPYRRGYLLHGEPGNGKTSLVKALASELNMNIYLLNLSMPNMTDSRLCQLMMQVADHSIVLMEDIDCAFVQRKRQEGKGGLGGLTFSGLLNALDGIASPDGQIIFMTTNHKEKLDPALIRPGRADVQVRFGNATQAQARQLFLRFFPDASEVEACQFALAIPDRKHSMASLQGYLMQHQASPRQALDHITQLVPEAPSHRFLEAPLHSTSSGLAARAIP